MNNHLLTMVILLSACADVPSGDVQRIISRANNEDKVVALFATQQTNEQYCVYQNELATSAWRHDPAAAFAPATATLLTQHSVSADDLSEALLLESDHTSRAYNTAPAAFYPLLVCGGSLASWPFVHKKFMPAIALLSCGAAALFIHRTATIQAEGDKIAHTSVEQLLANEIHDNDMGVHQLSRVLSWLVTENSLPCPAYQQAQGEANK